MKKLIIVASVAVFALASCKKDYTCECTTTVLGQTSTASTTINGKKNDVKESCENGSQTSSVGGFTTEVKCEIK